MYEFARLTRALFTPARNSCVNLPQLLAAIIGGTLVFARRMARWRRCRPRAATRAARHRPAAAPAPLAVPPQVMLDPQRGGGSPPPGRRELFAGRLPWKAGR